MDDDQLFDDRRFEEWESDHFSGNITATLKKLQKKRVLILLTNLKARIKTHSY
jgi:hypothetical protein